MGKGGVGKTTVAAIIAKGLAEKEIKVHLTTTDPANHLQYIIAPSEQIVVSNIDENKELDRYREEVLAKARETMNGDDLAYIEEDLRLKDELAKAGIFNKWWIINQSLFNHDLKGPLLQARAQNEKNWIKKVIETSNNNCSVIPINRDFL